MARPKPSLNKVYYQISEVSELTGVNESTLRNWEGRYDELHGVRRIKRRRHYTVKDIATIERIRNERLKLRRTRQEKPIESKLVDTTLFDDTTSESESSTPSNQTKSQLNKLADELKQVQKELREISNQIDK